MIKNENIICLSSIDWDFVWQGHQEIMSTLAENGNSVLFIENTGARYPNFSDFPRLKSRFINWFKSINGFRKERDNLYIFSPLVLPFPYSRLARWINRNLILGDLKKWLKAMDFSDPIIWVFLPTGLSCDLINNLRKKAVVYYCIDSFVESSPAAKKIAKTEKTLISVSDVVFTTSKLLYDYCAKFNSNVEIFPFAVDIEKFAQARSSRLPPPEDISDIRHPIVGYIGGIHKWIDQNLIEELARKNAHINFVFIGPVQTDISRLSGYKNIIFLGKKEHKILPLYIKEFDVCIIPYVLAQYTSNVYPTKLNEYLAMGKPVISTDLFEVKRFNSQYDDVVTIAKSNAEFDNALLKMLSKTGDADEVDRRIKVAQDNSWVSRMEKMSESISRAIDRRRKDKDLKWKDNLIYFYNTAKRKMSIFVSIIAVAYIIIFHSGFLWFAARPLKIDNKPQKADAIVVFGGGVGETGSPGKSTIERARFASELYNMGLSKTIIFSSGYTYKYSDAENMRLFAKSMSVPDKNIILEEKANSAYENVIYSLKIIKGKGYSSILLVSSPYNMRRVALVFRKQDPDLKVIYAPVPYCQFFDRHENIRLSQIKAILHEYFGIIYYFFKGYL